MRSLSELLGWRKWNCAQASRCGLSRLSILPFRAGGSSVTMWTLLGTSAERLPDDLDRHIGRVTALKAFSTSSSGAENIDVAGVHDATAAGKVTQSGNLGLWPRDRGDVAARHGHTALGGRTPVTPLGGLGSRPGASTIS